MQLSQHSLSDFVDCPRRYYLHYVARQAWPLLESGPGGLDPLEYRSYLTRGVVLHRMIERHMLGIGAEKPPEPNQEPELALWYSRFLATDLSTLPAQRVPELALVAPLGDAGLYVRYDLLAFDDERTVPDTSARRFVIVDWKTIRGNSPPSTSWFVRRLQTRAYLYSLVAGGAPYNDGVPITPDQCSMRYWLANFPGQPWAEVGYSAAGYAADARMIRSLAADIAARATQSDFPLTTDERNCTYCTYRTLCNRVGAPDADLVIDDEPTADDSDVPELEY